MWIAFIACIILSIVILGYVEYSRQDIMAASAALLDTKLAEAGSANKKTLLQMADEINQNDKGLQLSQFELAAMQAQSDDKLSRALRQQGEQMLTYPKLQTAIDLTSMTLNSNIAASEMRGKSNLTAFSNALAPYPGRTNANTAAIATNAANLSTLANKLKAALPSAGFFDTTNDVSVNFAPVSTKAAVDSISARLPPGTGLLAPADQLNAIKNRIPDAGTDNSALVTDAMLIPKLEAAVNKINADGVANIKAKAWVSAPDFNAYSANIEKRWAADSAKLGTLSTSVADLTSYRKTNDATVSGMSRDIGEVRSLISGRILPAGSPNMPTGDQLVSFSNMSRHLSSYVPTDYVSKATFATLSSNVAGITDTIKKSGAYADASAFASLSNYVRGLPTGPVAASTVTGSLNITQGSGTLRSVDNGDGLVLSSGSLSKSLGISVSDTANYGGPVGSAGIKIIGATGGAKGSVNFLNDGRIGATYVNGMLSIGKTSPPMVSLDVGNSGINTTNLQVTSEGVPNGVVAPASLMPSFNRAGNAWISTAMGLAEYSNVVVVGNLGRSGRDIATIGAHDRKFSRWTNLSINPDNDRNGGMVGIGTHTPGKKLDVNGDIRTSTQLCIGQTCITEDDLKKLKQGENFVSTDIVLLLDASDRKSYPGNGNRWYDLSSYKNHFSLPTSGAVWSSAGYFTVTSGHAAIGPRSDNFNIDTDHTVIMVAQPNWGNCNSVMNLQAIDGTRMINIHLPWCNGHVYYDVRGCCGGDTRVVYNMPNRNALKHFVFRTRTQKNPQREIFENNVSMVSSSGHGTSRGYQWGGPSYLWNYGTSGHPWAGRFHYIQIYNRALTNEEIANNYAALKAKFRI